MTPQKNRLYSLILVCFTLSSLACNEGIVLNDHKKFEEGMWVRKNKIVFDYEISENNALYDIYLNFRHTGNYPFENIYFFIETVSPDNKFAKDTAQMILADKKGRFLGKGIGDIFDYEFKFKEGIKFPVSGKYSIQVEQAMRVETIEEVTDFGIRIERASIE
ncbi:MAG: hypothetical protein CMO34_07760 [Verrucomicrobia bacterium]|nr:hypothetical protein [Verrucomicrobiota bacterium]